MKNWWVIPIVCVVIAGIVATTYYSGYRRGKKAVESTIVERADTLIIRDTTKVTEPKYITRRVVDSILVPVVDTVVDTVRLTDTLYIFLEREQIRWEDSLSVVLYGEPGHHEGEGGVQDKEDPLGHRSAGRCRRRDKRHVHALCRRRCELQHFCMVIIEEICNTTH